MRWDAAPLAGFLSAPRLTDEDVAEGVAVALAATGGDDAYHAVGGRPRLWDRRGVWAIDVVMAPWAGMLDLFNPVVAAAAARDLWWDAGGSWGWSTVFGTTAWRLELSAAREALRGGARAQYARLDAEPVGLCGARLAAQRAGSGTATVLGRASVFRFGGRP